MSNICNFARFVYIPLYYVVPRGMLRVMLRPLRIALERALERPFRDTKGNMPIRFGRGLLKGQSLLIPQDYSWRSTFLEMPGYFRGDNMREGSYVIDGGAYPGDFTVLASRMVGRRGRVFALEPNPDLIEPLKRFISLNKATANVEVVEAALANYSGVGNLHQNNVGSVLSDFASESARSKPITEVHVTTLDNIASGLGRVDFIKLDIEGAEIAAVEGSSQTIDRFRPSWAIASYHLVDGRQTHTTLHTILARHYITVNTGYPRHLTTYAHN